MSDQFRRDHLLGRHPIESRYCACYPRKDIRVRPSGSSARLYLDCQNLCQIVARGTRDLVITRVDVTAEVCQASRKNCSITSVERSIVIHRIVDCANHRFDCISSIFTAIIDMNPRTFILAAVLLFAPVSRERIQS